MAGNTFGKEGDAENAGEDSALTGLAAVAPQAAAAAAAIDQAGDLVDGANDAAKWVGGALDDVFGGGDEHPGQSTFPVDPDAAPESQAEYEAKMAATQEAIDKAVAENRRLEHLRSGRHGDVEHAIQGSEAADVRWAARKARAGKVQDAETEVHAGAFDDPRAEDVSQSAPHVKVGGNPVIDVDGLPTADHTPADVAPGTDVELNPQPIPPGKGAASTDVDDSSIIIVGGRPSARRARDAGRRKKG